jgi:ribonuclease P/MRP protein subunit POP3
MSSPQSLSYVSFVLTVLSRPQIALEDQETLLELLCSLLSPIGHYRSRYIQPSKGKRDKKRKRKEAEATESHSILPPAPDLTSYVDVGLSAVTRSLESATAKGRGLALTANPGNYAADEECDLRYYSTIFIARSGQPSILNSHLPQMIAVASATHPSKVPIRLVGLSKACEDRLSECLGVPRVSCVGIREGAPNSKALVDFALQHVPMIEVPWLEEAQRAEYKETKINTSQTTIGAKKQTSRTQDQGA